MIRIFIENKELEINETVQVAITKQFEELSNPTTIINDWSKTVSIPFTVKNNNIFGHIYNIDKLTVASNDTQSLTGIYFNPYKKLNMRLQWGDDVLMVGYAKMNEVKQNNGKGTYELTLFGELGKVFSEMKKITFDTTTDNTNYLIDGSKYVEEYINKDLVAASWNSKGQTKSKLQKKWIYRIDHQTGEAVKQPNPSYRVTDIIGFAPNNAFSEGFDYKNFQLTSNSIKSFADVLGDKFKDLTGVEPDTAIPNGLLPREIGEFRSYLQLPFIYWNKLFQVFKAKSEELTGYKFELDESWFNTSNPYWYNLVYMIKPFDMKGEESVTNYYKLVLYGDITWKDNLGAYTRPQTVPLHFTNDGNTETKPIADFTNNTFKMSDDYSVLFNTQIELDLDATHYTNIRISPANGLVVSVQFTDNNNIVKQELKYLMVDDAYSGDTKNYVEVARFGRQATGRFSFYPTLKMVLDKGIFGDVAKIQISAVWLNNRYEPFLDFLNTPFAPADGYANLRYYNAPTSSLPLTVNVITGRHRSNTYFTLNTLWNNERNLFDEIVRYCKMYRIGIFVNEYEKKITFKQYTKYFEEYTVVNWTDKIDKSKDYVIKPVTFDNKYILFNYDDSKTNLGGIYKEKYGFNYGDYRLTTEYNFNNSAKNLFEKITPSINYTDNVLSWINLSDNYTIKYSFPAEILVNNRDKDKKQVDIFGALFFHNGLGRFDSEVPLYLRPANISDDTIFQQSNSNYCYTQGQGELIRCNTYPKLDVVFGNNICLFNNPKENYTYINNYGGKGNVYSNFWENYLNERYNVQNKLITCYVTIKPTEFNQFKWNQFVKIGNQLCIVNKIYDYDVTSTSPTKVDLITIQNIDGYTSDNYNN